MKKSDFYYDLPPELIAQTPLKKRDESRLLVFSKENKKTSHEHFFDILQHLKSGDLLVLNKTRVLPARLLGKKCDSGGKIEFLLQKRHNLRDWFVLAKPAARAKVGTKFEFSHELSAEILERCEDGGRIVRFQFDGIFEEILERTGQVPLPHYIKTHLENAERYQTVYAKNDGSSAAPTAGLHFTPELLKKIEEKGVEICFVILHVGLGTFRPVKTDEITQHIMHSEYYEMPSESAEKINKAKAEGRRVIAVGTTSVRVLESTAEVLCQTEYQKTANNAQNTPKIFENTPSLAKYYVKHSTGETNIFIYPSYEFKIVDGLITNFHLPESTLIMLVSAFIGHDETMRIYRQAVQEKYRFFSFGDAMLLL